MLNERLLHEGKVSESRNTPNFTIISIRQINSILKVSGPNDAKFAASQGKSYTELALNNELPSQKREKFALLFDDLESKFLNKRSILAMLQDREEFVCVPVYLDSDLAIYNDIGIKICIQKIMMHMSRLIADKESDQYQKGIEDQARIETWLSENKI
jgi:hypothetical protein